MVTFEAVFSYHRKIRLISMIQKGCTIHTEKVSGSVLPRPERSVDKGNERKTLFCENVQRFDRKEQIDEIRQIFEGLPPDQTPYCRQ